MSVTPHVEEALRSISRDLKLLALEIKKRSGEVERGEDWKAVTEQKIPEVVCHDPA